MRNKALPLLFTIAFTWTSCINGPESERLYGTGWELEYLFGSWSSVDKLFPDDKPHIAFNRPTGKVEGDSGCNGYSAGYTVEGDSISFGEPGPTTMMYCGGGEGQFLGTIAEVDRFRINKGGRLHLLADGKLVMRFKKRIPSQIVEVKEPELHTGCYVYDRDGTVISLEITEMGETVKGHLRYTFPEKDSNEGVFEGTLRDDKLVGRYTYTSEGAGENTREVAFLVEEELLMEGFGELDESGTAFADINTIRYNATSPMSKTDCGM